jgi:hypothetical protein
MHKTFIFSESQIDCLTTNDPTIDVSSWERFVVYKLTPKALVFTNNLSLLWGDNVFFCTNLFSDIDAAVRRKHVAQIP